MIYANYGDWILCIQNRNLFLLQCAYGTLVSANSHSMCESPKLREIRKHRFHDQIGSTFSLLNEARRGPTGVLFKLIQGWAFPAKVVYNTFKLWNLIKNPLLSANKLHILLIKF